MTGDPGAHVPVNRPQLPGAGALLPYLRRIDGARHYTNHGGLETELATRLAAHYGVPDGVLTLAASGTAAITGAILATAGRATAARPLCLCPSYTFVATAVAASACGYQPLLADVGAGDWSLEPEAPANLDGVGVVLAVAPYGRMVDIAAWQRFSERAGIPVVVDAAACFDTLDAQAICRGTVPVAVSLHATKSFSTAEGGFILCGSQAMADDCMRALNFGFFTARESVGPSINGKLSEYHAAVGLAELDGWAQKRAHFTRVGASYLAAARAKGLEGMVFADAERANPYVLFEAPTRRTADAARERLIDRRIETRLWYGLGLHRQPQYAASLSLSLTVTDDVAPRLVGLPVAVDLPDAVIAEVVGVLQAALSS